MITDEIEMFIEDYKENLSKVASHYADELIQIRAGRANPRIIEKIVVDYYGTITPLNQMATISVPEARMILVSLWDISMVKTAVKAIENANIGVNPSDDGKVIRLVFPQLTEERRKELVKEISKINENAKIASRNFRREVLDEFKKMKKDSIITEDEMAKLEKDVQKILDDHISQLDKMYENKQKDIMEV